MPDPLVSRDPESPRYPEILQEPLRVLMITSEWPAPADRYQVPFITQQVNFLRQAGVDVQVFPFRGRKRLARYASAWQQAQKKIASGAYDLVHAQWGQSGLLALPHRIPLVVTFRGDDLEGIIGDNGRPTIQGRMLKIASRLVALAADQVILVSSSLARTLPRKDYHIIPSGIDLHLFCPAPQSEARRKLGLDPDRRYILFAGATGNPRKRFPLAKLAVSMLPGDLNAELLVADQILHKRIPDFMNASDVLLLTSLHEGSPNVVKEALACNLPVVSTDVGDVRERIQNISGCSIVQNAHPETIANALIEVLSHKNGIDGRSAIIDLDERFLSQKVIGIYHQAVKR